MMGLSVSGLSALRLAYREPEITQYPYSSLHVFVESKMSKA